MSVLTLRPDQFARAPTWAPPTLWAADYLHACCSRFWAIVQETASVGKSGRCGTRPRGPPVSGEPSTTTHRGALVGAIFEIRDQARQGRPPAPRGRDRRA